MGGEEEEGGRGAWAEIGSGEAMVERRGCQKVQERKQYEVRIKTQLPFLSIFNKSGFLLLFLSFFE